jgi:hypothetical protein
MAGLARTGGKDMQVRYKFPDVTYRLICLAALEARHRHNRSMAVLKLSTGPTLRCIRRSQFARF